MAMSRSLSEHGSDEVREEVSDVCCFCANKYETQPASYLCSDCGKDGRLLCGTCLRSHNSRLGNHNVTKIGSLSNSRIGEKNETLPKLNEELERLNVENQKMKRQLDIAKTKRDERQNVTNDLESKQFQSKSKKSELKSQRNQLLTEKTTPLEERTKKENVIKTVKTERNVKEGNIEELKKPLIRLNNQKRLDDLFMDNEKEGVIFYNSFSDVIEESDDLNTGKQQQASFGSNKMENIKQQQASFGSNKMENIEQQPLCCGSYKKQNMLVAAIDIGNICTGYAFSFNADPCKVLCNRYWRSRSIMTLKAPTVVLFDEKKRFHSFGYEAEDKYSDLADENEHHTWYFFRGFKKLLYSEKLTWNIEIEDDKGRKMTAIHVFEAVIHYQINNLLDYLNRICTDIHFEDIHWVLTVPALWNDSAKQFIREAAYKAGIGKENLLIASEQEAASLYIQMVSTDKEYGSESATFALATPGTKYMVINLGGNVDITVYEKQARGCQRELRKDGIGAVGGNKVDEEFSALLIRILGGPFFQKFVDENKEDHLDLQREFEIQKRMITPQSYGKLTIRVPQSIASAYKHEMKEDIDEAIERSPYSGKITLRRGKMKIDAEVFKHLFKSSTDTIASKIADSLKHPDVQGTNIIFMVGGFSESVMVQDAIMKAFPQCKVVVPADAGLTILKGAVIFGHQPVAITSRLFKYTYGINIFPAFDSKIHPEDRRVLVDGIYRCRDVFKTYVHAGDMVEVDEARSKKHVTLETNQTCMRLKLYGSHKRDPMYVDEDGTTYLGEVVIDLPHNEDKTKVEVKMIFGATEIEIKVKEMSQHTTTKAYFNCLS